MKKFACILVLLVALVPREVPAQFAFNHTGPTPLNYYLAALQAPAMPPPYRWSSTDYYQIWERLDSLCSPTLANYTHYPWRNTDLYQIWLKLDSCFSGSPGDSTLPGWALEGNLGTNETTNFLGTRDNNNLSIRVKDSIRWRADTNGVFTWRPLTRLIIPYTAEPKWDYRNMISNDSNNICTSCDSTNLATNCTIYGIGAGRNITKAHAITAFGFNACYSVVGSLTFSGSDFPATSGYELSAFGIRALYSNTTGFENTALGGAALFANTTGSRNTAGGLGSLQSNTTGGDNTAFGVNALLNNLTGNDNVAVGFFAGRDVTGNGNTFLGNEAGTAWSSGAFNTIIGNSAAGSAANSGTGNVALGYVALGQNSGSYNVAIGPWSGWWNQSLSHRLYFGASETFRGNAKKDTTEINIFGYSGTDSSDNRIHANTQLYINDGTNTAVGKRLYTAGAFGLAHWSTPGIDTTAKDAATLNTVSGKIRKDQTGTTYTVTNSFCTVGSIVTVALGTSGVTTGNQLSILTQTGAFIITFETAGVAQAPNKDTDIFFKIEN